MSRERFDWLDRWCRARPDIIRTPGTESNVKEIYDKCAELDRDDANVILNQFAEFGNHLGHYFVTGQALAAIVEALTAPRPDLRPAAFTSATGSAGTIGAGDWLKDAYGTKIVAVEALECPDDARERVRRAQHPGDRRQAHPADPQRDEHRPRGRRSPTAPRTSCSSSSTPTPGGRYLAAPRRPGCVWSPSSARSGISSICNILAAIKTAKELDLGPDEAVVTVATDGAAMYRTELDEDPRARLPGWLRRRRCRGDVRAAHARRRRGPPAGADARDRDRIFNLGYYTWVEQQGVSLEDFEARRDQDFWRDLRRIIADWDDAIEEFNARTGVGAWAGDGAGRGRCRAPRRWSAPAAGTASRPGRRSPRLPARPSRAMTSTTSWSGISTRPGLARRGPDNPFVRYRTSSTRGDALLGGGRSDADYVALVERLDAAVAAWTATASG